MFILGDIMTAREALLQIQAVLDVSTGNLTNGGIELSEREIDYIIQSICNGLENTDVKN
jgi:hypothetical protein